MRKFIKFTLIQRIKVNLNSNHWFWYLRKVIVSYLLKRVQSNSSSLEKIVFLPHTKNMENLSQTKPQTNFLPKLNVHIFWHWSELFTLNLYCYFQEFKLFCQKNFLRFWIDSWCKNNLLAKVNYALTTAERQTRQWKKANRRKEKKKYCCNNKEMQHLFFASTASILLSFYRLHGLLEKREKLKCSLIFMQLCAQFKFVGVIFIPHFRQASHFWNFYMNVFSLLIFLSYFSHFFCLCHTECFFALLVHIYCKFICPLESFLFFGMFPLVMLRFVLFSMIYLILLIYVCYPKMCFIKIFTTFFEENWIVSQ